MIAENRFKPKIHTTTRAIGSLEIKFEGEVYDGRILDTKVSINGAELCWISWADKDSFVQDLKEAIEKYFI